MPETPLTDETKADTNASDVTEETPLTDGVKPGEGDDKGEPSSTDPKDPSTSDGNADGGDEVVGAPENYEAFTMPDGMEPVAGEVEKFSTLAKEINLSQDNAQKVMDFMTGQIAEEGKQDKEALDGAMKEWVDSLKNDKDFGGDNYDQNLGFAKKALNQFGDESLVEDLNATGFANNPGLVKMLCAIGKAVSEDTQMPKPPEGDGGDGKSHADILYPDNKTG